MQELLGNTAQVNWNGTANGTPRSTTRLEIRNNIYQYRYGSSKISLKTSDKQEALTLEKRFRDMEKLIATANLKQEFIKALVLHRQYLAAMNLEKNKIEYIARIEASGIFTDGRPVGFKQNLDWLVQELKTELKPDEPSTQPTLTVVHPQEDPKQAITDTLTTSDLIGYYEQFKDHYQATGASKATIVSYGSKFNVLKTYLEKNEVQAVNRALAIAYKKHMLDTISISTTNNTLTVFGTLFKWLKQNDLITAEQAEIWNDLKVRSRGIKAKEEDKACTEEDAAAIEAHANTIDSTVIKNRNGTLSHRVAKKWIPLIMLYSGMRAGEASQLHKDDIKQVDDVWVFSVNNEKGKAVKNSTSIRFIPIHQKLIDTGILNLLDSDTEWLYGESCITSNIFGYHWNTEYQRIAGTKANRHSLRHRFIGTLISKDVDANVVSQLAGHTAGSITLGVYSTGFSIQKLQEAVNTL
jgi:integrase